MSLLEDMNRENEQTPRPESPVQPQEQRKIKLSCEGEDKRSITNAVTTDYSIRAAYDGAKTDTFKLAVNVIHDSSLGDKAAEWNVSIHIPQEKPWDVTRTGETERTKEISPLKPLPFIMKVTSPRGAKYGDAINVVLTLTSTTDPALSDSLTTRTTARQSVLVVKTQINHEKTVADSLAARSGDLGVLSILNPAPLKGYILVEAMDTDRLEEMVRGIKRARGLVKGEMGVGMDEVEKYLTPKSPVSDIVEGDIVELISGPFKGEKARVQNIDLNKEEITVELFEALVPIPVTVKGDSVRVYKEK